MSGATGEERPASSVIKWPTSLSIPIKIHYCPLVDGKLVQTQSEGNFKMSAASKDETGVFVKDAIAKCHIDLVLQELSFDE